MTFSLQTGKIKEKLKKTFTKRKEIHNLGRQRVSGEFHGISTFPDFLVGLFSYLWSKEFNTSLLEPSVNDVMPEGEGGRICLSNNDKECI